MLVYPSVLVRYLLLSKNGSPTSLRISRFSSVCQNVATYLETRSTVEKGQPESLPTHIELRQVQLG